MSMPDHPVMPEHQISGSKEMPLSLTALLPLKSVVITLQCKGYINLPLMDYRPVYTLLCHLLHQPVQSDQVQEHPLKDRLFVYCPETHYTPYSDSEKYRFQLTLLKGDDALLDTLISSLQRLHQFTGAKALPAPWKDKTAFHSITDLFSGRTLAKAADCNEWGMPQVTEEALYWQGQDLFIWRWLSPALSMPHDEDISQLSGRNKSLAQTLLSQLYSGIATLIARRSDHPIINTPLPDNIMLNKRILFQLSLNSAPAHGLSAGWLGKLCFSGSATLPFSWWCLLIMGQKLGLTPDNHLGGGHYQLTQADGYSPHPVLSIQNRLTTRIGSNANLRNALNHIRQNSQSGQEKLTPAKEGILQTHEEMFAYDFEADHPVLNELQQHLHEIQCGTYQTPVLRGWLIEKNDGSYRPLAVPPFNDRVLQRAVSQKLTPILDRLMNKGSFGYRPRRSRKDAMQHIAQAVREGYCWVFESDLKDFFDSVEPEHLAIRLSALFGHQPVIQQIMHWMAADVVFRGQQIRRTTGLPQGSPLSPLLANFMLDNYDRRMEQAGFRLIRFADDFVIMCKNPQEARQAAQQTQHILSGMDLELNPDKTHIREMTEGLRFLGYLFVNNTVLDVSGEKHNKAGRPTKPVPDKSWLAQVSQRTLRHIRPEARAEDIKAVIQPQPDVAPIGQREHSGTVLCITGQICVLYTRQGRLAINRDETRLLSTPWKHLQAVILFGNHHITTPAMRQAMAEHVPIHLADNMGRYQGCCWNGQGIKGHYLWFRQRDRIQHEADCLSAAKALIKGRIRGCISVLRNRNLPGIDEMKAFSRHLEQADTLKRLNGYEGAAAACYFRAVCTYLPEDFRFSGRNRQPPKDPFNVLLSLGYTLLYGYVDSLIRVSGLLPLLGFYHQNHGLHSTLASDLMESFRHRVERKALSLIRRGQIRVEHFQYYQNQCLIEDSIRRFYLAELIKDFETPALPEELSADHNNSERLTDQILKQNRSLIRWINEGTPFVPA